MFSSRTHDDVLIAHSRPKLLCAYPLVLFCSIGALLLTFIHDPAFHAVCGGIYMSLVLMVAIILGTDCQVHVLVIAVLLALVLILFALVVSLLWVDVVTPPTILVWRILTIPASAKLFAATSFVYWIALSAAWLQTRMIEFEIRANVIVHRRSFFGFGATEIGRYDAQGLRAIFTKTDVFEYWLLGVGRLELWPGAEKQAFVVDHFPAKLIPRINHILAAKEMRIDPDNAAEQHVT